MYRYYQERLYRENTEHGSLEYAALVSTAGDSWQPVPFPQDTICSTAYAFRVMRRYAFRVIIIIIIICICILVIYLFYSCFLCCLCYFDSFYSSDCFFHLSYITYQRLHLFALIAFLSHFFCCHVIIVFMSLDMFSCRSPPPPATHQMFFITAACASPEIAVRPQLGSVHRAPPAAGKRHPLSTPTRIHFYTRTTTNKQWTRLGTFIDLKTILLISGIESNPGPSQLSYQQQTIIISHININSITAVNKLDELQQYVDTHNVQILALTETKLINDIATSQYKLHNFHAPLTRHRDRHGGGVAIYIHKSLPFQRQDRLELSGEKWIWVEVKLQDISLLICCVYLPPNLTSDRLQLFTNNLTESICLSTVQNATETFIMGDFNTGNIYLDDNFKHHSGVTPFDHALKDVTDMFNLQQLINQPTRISNNCENL